jgi:uncharacterized protein YndB with AHSA1/START domain
MTSSADTSDREIVQTRILKAPREKVWKAWTEPERLIQWWGPQGFTNTFHEISITPGGVWRFMMHGPDGVDYPNKIIFEEVKEPERLVYIHSGDDGADDITFRSIVTFKDLGDKTELTMRAILQTKEIRDETAKYAVEGGKQTIDRLEAHLATM